MDSNHEFTFENDFYDEEMEFIKTIERSKIENNSKSKFVYSDSLLKEQDIDFKKLCTL